MHLFPRGVLAMITAMALLTLGACATSTPYQPLSASSAVSGGYTDQRLGENRYRVTFAGNTLTSRERVESYLLYRAAELTRERGYDWFVVVDRETDHEIRREIRADPRYSPVFAASYGEWRPYWRYYRTQFGWSVYDPYHGDPFWTKDVDARTVERYEATAEIKLGRGTAPQDDGPALDAAEVIARMGPSIVYPKH